MILKQIAKLPITKLFKPPGADSYWTETIDVDCLIGFKFNININISISFINNQINLF